MNRRHSKRRGASGPPFVQLHHFLLDSQAWHQLSFAARSAYLEICRLYSGVNNGRIALSVRLLAERLPCNKETASRTLNELELAGFVAVNKTGSFKRDGARLCTEYRLTVYRDDTTGELPTKAFNPGKVWLGAPDKSVRKNRTLGTEIPDTKSEKHPFGTENPDRKDDLGSNLGTEKPYTYRIYTIGDCAHTDGKSLPTSQPQALAKRAPQERCSERGREDNQQSSPLAGENGELAQFNAENVVRLFQERVANNDAA